MISSRFCLVNAIKIQRIDERNGCEIDCERPQSVEYLLKIYSNQFHKSQDGIKISYYIFRIANVKHSNQYAILNEQSWY